MPPHTGKTTCPPALMDHLNREESSLSLCISLEAAQGARENVNEAMRAILDEIVERARVQEVRDYPKLRDASRPQSPVHKYGRPMQCICCSLRLLGKKL